MALTFLFREIWSDRHGILSVLRRWALRDKMPIREIARRTGLSRNTIKKYLREDAVEPRRGFNLPAQHAGYVLGIADLAS